jgi:hypothetical protein
MMVSISGILAILVAQFATLGRALYSPLNLTSQALFNQGLGIAFVAGARHERLLDMGGHIPHEHSHLGAERTS